MHRFWMAVLSACVLAGCGSASLETEASASPSPSASVKYTITNPVDLETSYADMTGYQWLYDPSPAFVEITFEESIRMFSEKGTGILYYGRTNCPWCQRAVPVMNEVAQDMGVTIYYIDASKALAVNEDGSVDQERSTELYDELISYIGDVLPLDEEGQPSFQIPEVLTVKNGEITGHHLSLVDSFELTSDDAQMTEEQEAELADIYRRMFLTVVDQQ